MAIGFIFNNPGQTQEQYDAAVEQLNLAQSLPEGWIFHAAGPTEDGWRVVEVWESQEAADAYFEERLGQVLQNLVCRWVDLTPFRCTTLLPAELPGPGTFSE